MKVHLSHVIQVSDVEQSRILFCTSFWSSARMHDTWAKFLVWDSGTSFRQPELWSSAVGINNMNSRKVLLICYDDVVNLLL